MSNEPNHVCKNCGKAYYACEGCDKIASWRSVACSQECFLAYSDAIEASRNEVVVKPVDVIPESKPNMFFRRTRK